MKKFSVLLILPLIFLSSCFTLYTNHLSKIPKPRDDKKVELKSAFVDTTDNLTINFLAKPARKKKDDYTTIVNLRNLNDTVTKFNDNCEYSFKNERKTLEEKQKIKPSTSTDVSSNINAEIRNGEIYFDYIPEKNTEINKSNYCIAIENLYFKRKSYYFLFPFTVILDIITSPIQLLGLILILMFIKNLKNQIINNRRKRRNKRR